MPLPTVDGATPTPSEHRASKALAPLAPEMEVPAGMKRVTRQEKLGTWETPGQKIIAYYLGMRDSSMYKGRKLVDLANDDGEALTYACPVVLEQLLRAVPLRAAVCIHYRGEEKTGQGNNTVKLFEVFIQ